MFALIAPRQLSWAPQSSFLPPSERPCMCTPSATCVPEIMGDEHFLFQQQQNPRTSSDETRAEKDGLHNQSHMQMSWCLLWHCSLRRTSSKTATALGLGRSPADVRRDVGLQINSRDTSGPVHLRVPRVSRWEGNVQNLFTSNGQLARNMNALHNNGSFMLDARLWRRNCTTSATRSSGDPQYYRSLCDA